MPDVLQFPVPKSVDETKTRKSLIKDATDFFAALDDPKGRPCLMCGCGSMDFNMMVGGALECAKCDTVSMVAGWFHYDPDEAG